jgi:LysR family transcriptional activator of mexEF-oprN operon
MNRINLRHIDLNLFVIFEMIMQERSVPRAAKLLSLGQPAVRQALARLGTMYNDPLLVRIGQDLEPTPRALELEGVLRPALDSIAAAVSQARLFDPATSNEVIRLGLSDDVELAFPGLIRQLSIEAPDIVVVVRRTHYLSVSHQLSAGEISLGICYIDAIPTNVNCQILRRGRSVMVHSDPAAGPMSLDGYCARPHALVSMAGDLSGFIDHIPPWLATKRG